MIRCLRANSQKDCQGGWLRLRLQYFSGAILALSLAGCVTDYRVQLTPGPPVPPIDYKPLPVRAGLILPRSANVPSAPVKLSCAVSFNSLHITAPPDAEFADMLSHIAFQTVSQAFERVEVVTDKASVIGKYDVLIELDQPTLTLKEHCGFNNPFNAFFAWQIWPLFIPLSPEAEITVSGKMVDRTGQIALAEVSVVKTGYTSRKEDTGFFEFYKNLPEVIRNLLVDEVRDVTVGLTTTQRFTQYVQALPQSQVAIAPSLPVPPRSDSPKRDIRIEGKLPAEYVSAQYGRAWAVVIGINEYAVGIPRLHYAVADAQAIGDALEAEGFNVIRLLNQEATGWRIREVLGDELPSRIRPEDRLVVFYAGHGESRSIEGGREMGYLLPVDAKRDRLHRTALSMGELRQLADLLPAKHVLFLVDVCYGGIAGQQFRSLPSQTAIYLKQITRERGRQLISAGGPGQQVVEGPQWGHSVFTYFLLAGMKGLADLNDDGVIPASELYAYLDGRVSASAENQQRPELWSLAAEKGEFVFIPRQRGRRAQ